MQRGEVVAALAKAERHVERRDVEREGEQRLEPHKGRIQRDRAADRRDDREQPCDRALALFAGVERVLEPLGARRDRRAPNLAVAQRMPLLEQQRGDDGDHGHWIATKIAQRPIRARPRPGAGTG